MYTDALKVTVDKEKNTVSLSIRTTDSKVEVHTFSRPDFLVMVAQFNAMDK